MIKIAHMADIHIRNLKYHKEYGEVFEKLYEKLEEEEVDIIYVGGDIAHTKTQLSPEYFDMCSNFLSSLADIADTYVILGNHDGNLRTASRQDAVTPIVEALEHPKLKLLKNSGEWEVSEGVVFNNLSIFDTDNWTDPSDPDKINIAFYHGSISGCSTDVGWVMNHGEYDLSIFEEFDFAMLGDIHKTNQVLDAEGRIRYCGSLVQQNHGETNDKGFLIWEIEDKDNFKVRHVKIENPKPFITIELTKNGRMPRNLAIPKGARLRLVSNNNLPLNKMKRAVDVAKTRFKPCAITFLNRALGNQAGLEEISSFAKENLRDISVQERLIKEYLQDYEIEDDNLQKVFELNKKYNSAVEESEEVSRNINWKLKSIEWDNLFNYGEGNYIDFEKLDGIVGIFGKNYSGKSSIVDSTLFTIFNSTSKNERKNLNIINQNKEYGQGKVKIEIGNKTYTILRQCEKYVKRLHGKDSIEAKTDLDFLIYDPATDETTELNGLSRNDTDKRIRKVFGTMEDFLATSMSSQLGSMTFINEGSTRRKELLAKFLDLEIFERKFKLAKEDAADLRGALKLLEGREFDEEIKSAKERLSDNEAAIKNQKKKCQKLENKLELFSEEREKIQKSVDSIPAEVIDIFTVKGEFADKKEELIFFNNRNEFLNEDLILKKGRLEKIIEFIDSFDIEGLKEKKKNSEELKQQLDIVLSEILDKTSEINRKENKIKLLQEVPCGDSFPECKFIKDAYHAKITIEEDENSLAVLKISEDQLGGQIDELQPNKIDKHLEKYTLILRKQEIENSDISKIELEIEKNVAIVSSIEHQLHALERKIDEYESNKDAIENIQELLIQKKEVENKIERSRRELKQCEENILELYKSHGSSEQEVKNLTDQKQELVDLQNEYAAYDLFIKSMHSNGISYDIIKKKLPVVNNEIAKVLANVVDFEIFFEEDGRRLNIFIKHPSHDARPLEMGSGAEKTIAAMAIRLALLSVSNLPKPNLFILDEPGTALDEGNMEGFIGILDLVKSYFRVVLLVSHLESLKDCVDMQITIERKGSYAHVNHRA